MLGQATVDHSGRVRDRTVQATLNWSPGHRTSTTIRTNSLALRRTHDGGVPIDARGRVYLPVGPRSLLGIAVNERVALVAAPQQGLLLVYPARVVLALLADAEIVIGHVQGG